MKGKYHLHYDESADLRYEGRDPQVPNDGICLVCGEPTRHPRRTRCERCERNLEIEGMDREIDW